MDSADPEGSRIVDPMPPLRLGLLVDSLTQPAWVERALRRVVEDGNGEFVLVVRNAAPAPAVASSRAASWWRNRGQLLYGLFRRLERRALAGRPDPFAPTDISALVAGVPVVDVVPAQSRVADVIGDDDLERIRAAAPDVLVRLGFRILRGGILGVARLGVWSYHHGDHERYRGGPPAFWEVMEGNPVTGTILQRLTESLDDGEVLYRSWSATNPFSVARSRAGIYWKGSEFLARVLQRVRDEGATAGAPPVSTYGHRLYVTPTNREMASGLVRLARRRVREKWNEVMTIDQCFMAYRFRAGLPDDNREPDMTPFRFRPILPPKDRFWADPFPMQVGGGYFVLFEDYPYATRRGVISALELGPKGPVGAPAVVLSCDYHLSYPFLFTWRGETFMMPETADAGRVEVYRAVKAPYEWTLESVVLNGAPMADCTVAEIEGRWWMFANTAVPGASFWDELHAFHGPGPLGPWTPHRANPVVSDVRRARPAGGLFRRGGEWFRPSQDCSNGYGGALNIQRIRRLDLSGYEEESVGRVSPDWQPGLTGVHTVNAAGGLTVIDAKRRVSRLPG